MLSKYNKDDVGLKLPGVYSIPRECGKVYTLDTMPIESRGKEHH